MTALYAKLARRYLLGRKGRSLMTFLGVAFGITMVVAVLLTNNAILASYEQMLAAAAGRADLQVSSATGIGFPADLLSRIAKHPGVAAAVPVVSSSAPVAAGERQASATFYGIDPEADRQVRDYHLTAGRLPETAHETAISADLAGGLGVGAGSELLLLTTTGLQPFTVVGIFDAAGTVRGALGPFGVLELEGARAAFGKEGRLDLVDLVLAPGAGPDRVQSELSDQLGSAVRVGRPIERSRDMAKLLDAVLFVLTQGGAISLFAGAFIIYTNVSMSVAERRRDLSILRALGMPSGEVIRLVLAEAGLLGLAGSLLGLVWGYGVATAMAGQMTDQFLRGYGLQTAQVSLDLVSAAIAIALGVGAALFAAYGPARETVRVSPIEAMRPGEEAGREFLSGRRILLALGLLMGAGAAIWLTWPREGMLSPLMLRIWGALLGLALLGVVVALPNLLLLLNRAVLAPLLRAVMGITGRLASDNLVRQPRRTAATICALMVSLSYMVGMGGVSASQSRAFDRWYEKNIGWDLNIATSFVSVGALVEMDEVLEAQLAEVEGVRLVSPQKFTRFLLADGEQAFLQVFDTALLRQYSETDLQAGEWEEVADALQRGGAAVISPAVGRRLGIGLGDRLTLPAPSGEVELVVAGIMTDITPYGGTVQIDRQDYLRHWGDRTSTNIAVMVAEGQDPAQVRERILAHVGGQMPLTVRLNREFWTELRAQYEAFYKLMDGLIWIAVLVSGLAIANTLYASFLERRREFGVMRAVGTKRSEVVRVVAGEAFSTGVVGGLIGVAAGLGLQWLMVSASESINGAAAVLTADVASIALAIGVALLLAPVAGLIPAVAAARMDVVEALRYE